MIEFILQLSGFCSQGRADKERSIAPIYLTNKYDLSLYVGLTSIPTSFTIYLNLSEVVGLTLCAVSTDARSDHETLRRRHSK